MKIKENTNVVFLTNIPAPYREKLHEELSISINKYKVLYCNTIEPNRKWKFELGNYEKIFLPVISINIFNRFIHFNKNIFKELNKTNPDVVITSGFGPSMLLAFLWSKLKNKKHIPFTDANIHSESKLSFFHKFLRKIIFNYSYTFIGASNKSIDLYTSYNINKNNCFKSVLFINNHKFNNDIQKKEYDLMFSGQLIDRKMPMFFIKVVSAVEKKMNKKCKVLILGDGPLKEKVLLQLEKYNIDFEYPGFIQQDQLPNMYKNSKIFLFPTLKDPWGVVVNEAMAAGLPVITTPEAGSADELILNNINGYVLTPEINLWSERIVELLNNKEKYEDFSINSKNIIKDYTFKEATNGVLNAINKIKE